MSRIDGSALKLAGGLLLHPIVLAAIGLLWMNDHILKASYPGLVTGKLSDVCGMIFFPLFLTGALEVAALPFGRSPRFGVRGVALAGFITGLGLAAIKLSDVAADVYRWAFGLRWLVQGWLLHGTTELPRVHHVMDPSDLVALPGLAVPILLAWRYRPGPRPSTAD